MSSCISTNVLLNIKKFVSSTKCIPGERVEIDEGKIVCVNGSWKFFLRRST